MLYAGRREAAAGYQHPVTSCERDQCTAPPALAVEAVRDQLGRGGADGRRLHCLCTALSSSGRENLPQSLGVGSMWAGTVHVCAAQLMAKGLCLGAAQHGQPRFAASRPGHRTPGDTLGTMGHACSCPRVWWWQQRCLCSLWGLAKEQSPGRCGCCCHGSPCSQAGPLMAMAVLPDGHPPSGQPSLPGHPAAHSSYSCYK